MIPDRRRYLAREMVVSAVINAVLSMMFALLVLRGGEGRAIGNVTVGALVRDAVPQSFMIALMASLVPTLLTRKRLGRGAVKGLSGRGGRRSHPIAVSLATALIVGIVAGAVQWILLPVLLPGPTPFATVLPVKALYGALLGAGVTLFAVRRALADGEQP